MADQIILGIDPGTTMMGYGVIQVSGKQMTLLSLGSIALNKLGSHQEKLSKIHERTHWLMKEFNPTHCAIEAPFYGKNVQSMLKLGRAQGVAMAAIFNRGIEVVEYSPKRIKQSITGNGNASKEQVAGMLQQLLKFTELPKHLDATDGLAVAVCHHFQLSSPLNGKSKYKNWGDFIKANGDRIVR